MAKAAILGRPALSGGPLAGDKIVKMVFIDEAGTGNPLQEPHIVLAAVIVDADTQWKQIERYLVNLASEAFGGPVPGDFAFHATELFSGGKYFTREKYSKDYRWAVLDELVKVPAKFNLPIAFYTRERAATKDLVDAYKSTFIEVAATVEAFMRVQPIKGEIASLILEDLPQIRSHVKDIQQFLQQFLDHAGFHAHEKDRLWLSHIMGEPHFEQKSIFSPLQIADACAFAIKRQIMKKPDARRFFAPLVPMIISPENPKPGAWELNP